MSSKKEKIGAIEQSVATLKKELEELDNDFDVNSDNAHHKPHLIQKRKQLLLAIEMGEKLLQDMK